MSFEVSLTLLASTMSSEISERLFIAQTFQLTNNDIRSSDHWTQNAISDRIACFQHAFGHEKHAPAVITMEKGALTCFATNILDLFNDVVLPWM